MHTFTSKIHKPLNCGFFVSKTRAKMDHIDIALDEVGNHEEPIGSNWGKDVQKYLKSVGITFPAAWCMAFVYWCCKQSDSETPLIRTGGVLKQWQKIDPKYKHTTPKEGDIFIQNHGKGLGHCGFIERIEGDTLYTIEGNSNNEGSRAGYEVCKGKRLISSCVGFIRLP